MNDTPEPTEEQEPIKQEWTTEERALINAYIEFIMSVPSHPIPEGRTFSLVATCVRNAYTPDMWRWLAGSVAELLAEKGEA